MKKADYDSVVTKMRIADGTLFGLPVVLDVASLITGAFSPLTGFMKKADYDSVVSNMRTTDGTLFGLPVVLDISKEGLQGKKILLKYDGTDMAVMDVEEEWEPDKKVEAKKCYGTDGADHP